jgi:uncharacterized protein (DUF934 family)
MPTLLRLDEGGVRLSVDEWTTVGGGDDVSPGPVIVSAERFAEEADGLLAGGRKVGVRLRSDQGPEALVYDLPRLSLIALEFPKFTDGRAFTTAVLLRERYGFTGEIRAVGDVLREQAGEMVRCGINAFEPSDGSTAEDWERVLARRRRVYQTSADGRAPAWVERQQ